MSNDEMKKVLIRIQIRDDAANACRSYHSIEIPEKFLVRDLLRAGVAAEAEKSKFIGVNLDANKLEVQQVTMTNSRTNSIEYVNLDDYVQMAKYDVMFFDGELHMENLSLRSSPAPTWMDGASEIDESEFRVSTPIKRNYADVARTKPQITSSQEPSGLSEPQRRLSMKRIDDYIQNDIQIPPFTPSFSTLPPQFEAEETIKSGEHFSAQIGNVSSQSLHDSQLEKHEQQQNQLSQQKKYQQEQNFKCLHSLEQEQNGSPILQLLPNGELVNKAPCENPGDMRPVLFGPYGEKPRDELENKHQIKNVDLFPSTKPNTQESSAPPYLPSHSGLYPNLNDVGETFPEMDTSSMHSSSSAKSAISQFSLKNKNKVRKPTSAEHNLFQQSIDQTQKRNSNVSSFGEFLREDENAPKQSATIVFYTENDGKFEKGPRISASFDKYDFTGFIDNCFRVMKWNMADFEIVNTMIKFRGSYMQFNVNKTAIENNDEFAVQLRHFYTTVDANDVTALSRDPMADTFEHDRTLAENNSNNNASGDNDYFNNAFRQKPQQTEYGNPSECSKNGSNIQSAAHNESFPSQKYDSFTKSINTNLSQFSQDHANHRTSAGSHIFKPFAKMENNAQLNYNCTKYPSTHSSNNTFGQTEISTKQSSVDTCNKYAHDRSRDFLRITSADKIQRKCFGEKVDIGALYDAKRDQFHEEFENFLPPKLDKFCRLQRSWISAKYSVGDLNEAVEFLDISREQQVSVAVELCSSSIYQKLMESALTKHANHEKTFVVVYTNNTQVYMLDLNAYRPKKRQFGESTHLVNAIGYGSAVVAIFTSKSSIGDSQLKEIKTAIHDKCEKPFFTSKNAQILKGLNAQFNVIFCAHPSLKLPATVEAENAVIILRNLPQILRSINNGCGHQIYYEMVPLQKIIDSEWLDESNKYMLCGSSQNDHLMKSIADLQAMTHVLKSMEYFRTEFEYCFSEEDITFLTDIFSNFINEKESLMKECQELIVKQRCAYRSHERYDRDAAIRTQINELCEYANTCIAKTNQNCDKLNPLKERIEFARWLKTKNVPILWDAKCLSDKLAHQKGNTRCFVYFNRLDTDDRSTETKLLFEKLINEGAKGIYYAVDRSDNLAASFLNDEGNCLPSGERKKSTKSAECEQFRIEKLVENVKAKEESLILKFHQLDLICDDYLEEIERKRGMSIAKYKVTPQNYACPENAVDVEFVCPNSCVLGGVCEEKEFFWVCDECIQQLKYFQHVVRGKEVDYFFCACGRVPASEFEYRCAYKKHGDKFYDYPPENLKIYLNQLDSTGDDINILFLGETGAGKTTFINGLANYLMFESLEDAIKNDGPICLVPQSISHHETVNDTIETQILHVAPTVPDRHSESHIAGESQTQYPRAYVFRVKGRRVRIIDTPGMADTKKGQAGRDDENFNRIFAYVPTLKTISGICIVMQPNITRLSVIFKYCINGILSRLHRDATKNIFFCFTNAGATHFEAGGSYDLLKMELNRLESEQKIKITMKHSDVYFTENGSFGFLHKVKCGIKYDEEKYRAFDSAWEKSNKEMRRMIDNVASREPHRIMGTVSLNEARRTIYAISKPLACILKAAQGTITKLNEDKMRLSQLDVQATDFEKQLMFRRVRIVTSNLPYPRTVCTTVGPCAKIRKDANGHHQTIFEQHCHSHCYLDGVIQDQCPEPALQHCAAMRYSETRIECKECGCAWNKHMHIRYDQREEVSEELDDDVKDSLDTNGDKQAALKLAIEISDAKVVQNMAELNTIKEIAANFSSFLQHNSIRAHNDQMRAYLEFCIEQETEVAKCTNDYSKVEGMQQFLLDYEQRITFIQKSGENATTEPHSVMQYKHELFDLKLWGSQIRELYDRETEGQLRQAKYSENEYMTRCVKKRKGFGCGKEKTQSQNMPSISTNKSKKLTTTKYGGWLQFFS